MNGKLEPSKRKRTRVLFCFLVVLALYVGSYAVNSVMGGYWSKPVTGSIIYADSGLGLLTLFLWQPRFGYRDDHYSSVLGKFFAPLITVDQIWIHPRLDLFDENDERVIFEKTVKWHSESLSEK